MVTPLQQHNAPPWGAVAITPADGAVLTTDRCVPFRALYVGTGGNLTIRLLDGSTHTLMNVPTGTTLRLQFDMVFETGTTATDLVGLY